MTPYLVPTCDGPSRLEPFRKRADEVSELPSMPFFVEAYEAATSHLSELEDARYNKLLRLMWMHGGRVPNDDAWLARKYRKTPAEIAEQIRPLIVEFCQTEGNWITQKRLQKEWLWCQAKRRANSVAAKSLWKKRKASSERNAEAGSERYAPTPTPTPTPIKKEESISVANGHARRRRRSPLDDSWRPAKGVAPHEQGEFTRFQDYCRAHAKRYADWEAAWRNWRNSPYRVQTGPTNPRIAM